MENKTKGNKENDQSIKEAGFRIIGMDEAMTMMEEEGYII